ncbi:MAG TPA: hypothetical protein VHM26_04105 [Chitinophagaceae bacterium]|jgi:hypothetical protein|nr:hypothetical protein [Chitinophagaceae bacterium]
MITFHFAGDTIGGVPVLIVRLTEALAARGEKVKIIAKDHFIVKELQARQIDFVHVKIDEHTTENLLAAIDENDVLVCIEFSYYLFPLMKKNPRLLFYNIFVDSISRINRYKWNLDFKSMTRKLVNRLHRKKALYLMDGPGLRSLKTQLNLSLNDPRYLPIPVDTRPVNTFQQQTGRDFNNKIRITYVGRSEQWKIMPFEKILRDIIDIKDRIKTNIELKVVTDDVEKFRNMISDQLGRLPQTMKVEFVANIKPADMSAFLLANSDLHFAMGTAVLEGAKLGIPSVLVDVAENKIGDNYRYKWIHQTLNYSLGDFVEANTVYEGMVMEDILAAYFAGNDTVNTVSGLCYRYVLDNHAIDKVADDLIRAAAGTEFRFRDAKGVVIYYSAFHRALKKLVGA